MISGSEMAFRKIASNLEILHWSMQYFCMGGLYKDMGSSGIFGGIFRAMEMAFPFVGGEKDLTGSIFRVRVLEGNPNTKNHPGWWGGSRIAGEILREQFPSQFILKRFEEIFRKREKVFQVSENTTKIRFKFLGCYRPSPLKRNLVLEIKEVIQDSS